MRSMLMPSRSHHTESRLSPNRAWGEANGTPLSVRIAVFVVTQHELTFVVCTPQLVGHLSMTQVGSLGLIPFTFSALDQTMSIKDKDFGLYLPTHEYRALDQTMSIKDKDFGLYLPTHEYRNPCND